MNITVIIPTLNEEDHIGNILSDLKKQTHAPLEVLVIDGNSIDKTKAIVEKHSHAKLIPSEKPVGNQRHVGATLGKGELLVFLDADTKIGPTFLENVVLHMNKKKLDTACSFYIPTTKKINIQAIYMFFNILFYVFQKIRPSGAGSFIAIKKLHYDKIGGFEKDYIYDDIHFIRKAAKKGKFGIIPITIHVSHRRFEKEGFLKTTLTYFLLSIFFFFGAFKIAEVIKYKFGHYKSS